MGLNKQYKDSVFTLLFGEPDILRELYGAICGVPLDPATPITINTLEGALFMERINDISFEIAGKLVVLLEYQSTIKANMALRLLMYISGKKIAIPRPEFIVLYNGTAPYPDESTLRLSESFEESGLPGLTAGAGLELVVVVYILAGRRFVCLPWSCFLWNRCFAKPLFGPPNRRRTAGSQQPERYVS
ncbi:MAG: hypothetical protein LBO80_03795 [Treponema sp.]|jgi:hypothetical protein|nr:hypothetical protein [Treponema sp.]